MGCKDTKKRPISALQREQKRRPPAVFSIRCLKNYFAWASSETVSFLRPFARRAASMRRPLGVDIRSRKPCLFRLFLCEGWKVLFMVYLVFIVFPSLRGAKVKHFGILQKFFMENFVRKGNQYLDDTADVPPTASQFDWGIRGVQQAEKHRENCRDGCNDGDHHHRIALFAFLWSGGSPGSLSGFRRKITRM